MAWGLSLGVGAGLAIGTGWIIKDIATKSTEGWMRAIKTTADKLDRAVELDAFRDRVKELESSLAEHEEKIKAMEKVGKMKMEELAAPVADLNSRITELVGEKGAVSSAYGGYRIAVSDPATFPWLEVLVTLINASYDVWFSKEDEEFVIKCKPPSGS